MQQLLCVVAVWIFCNVDVYLPPTECLTGGLEVCRWLLLLGGQLSGVDGAQRHRCITLVPGRQSAPHQSHTCTGTCSCSSPDLLLLQ